MGVMPLEMFIVLFCYFQATENIPLQAVMVWTHIGGFFVEYERISESNIQDLNNIWQVIVIARLWLCT